MNVINSIIFVLPPPPPSRGFPNSTARLAVVLLAKKKDIYEFSNTRVKLSFLSITLISVVLLFLQYLNFFQDKLRSGEMVRVAHALTRTPPEQISYV